ncbi:hypothetical protein EI94DRAFT_1703377 [Lactarius quietus]|nr:hypothetical protein EI94DRAFT_1703377 [Lactarius quietus]
MRAKLQATHKPIYPIPDTINYEDGNLNVAIPVFSVYGNHHDPQGAGPEGAFCALDMLAVAGLVNYIGKVELLLSDVPADGIAVRPVLLRRGNTHLGYTSSKTQTQVFTTTNFGTFLLEANYPNEVPSDLEASN